DADVDLDGVALEPRAAALRELRWLRPLGKAEKVRVEPPRVVLAARGHRELNVVDGDDPHGFGVLRGPRRTRPAAFTASRRRPDSAGARGSARRPDPTTPSAAPLEGPRSRTAPRPRPAGTRRTGCRRRARSRIRCGGRGGRARAIAVLRDRARRAPPTADAR